jgi:hypothetical protein
MNKKTALSCENKDCRDCSVYSDFFECDKIQTLLKELLKENDFHEQEIENKILTEII